MCIQITHTNNQQDAEVQVQGIILKKYTDDTNPFAKGPHSFVHPTKNTNENKERLNKTLQQPRYHHVSCPPVQVVFEVKMSSILVGSNNHDGCLGYGSPNRSSNFQISRVPS